MIKNVIFDIGRVLIFWRPEKMCEKICPDVNTAEKVCAATYLSPLWPKLDAGEISVAEAVEVSVKEMGEEYRGYIVRAYNDFTYLADVIPEGINLAKRLKKEGYNLYLASNFNERVYDLAKRLSLFDIFSGYIFSFEEKIVKPNPEFFVRLCKRYSLSYEECAFIDDLPANVEGARSLGITGFVYSDNAEGIYNEILQNKTPS